MLVKNIPNTVDVLIRIANNGNIAVDNRIIAIDILKKTKYIESVIIEARQPIMNKYAAKDPKTNKFRTISYKKDGRINNDYVIPKEVRPLYDLEMKKLLEFDFKVEPEKLFEEAELILFLPKSDIEILISEGLVTPLFKN